jgi:DNA-binding NarL/FixJ family response regulator
MGVPDKLKQGRESYRRRAWGDAYESFSLADQTTPLEGEDLELLAVSAYLIGRDDDFLRVLERAHHAYVNAGNGARAVRCAFWLGLGLLLRGETARATGWLARAQRLLEREGRDCVERGYLLLPVAEQHFHTGHHESAYTAATDAAGIGERFKDADLIACARHLQGRALVQQAEVEKGLVLLDEAMVAVTAGELSPLMTGLIYCSVIDACQQVYALERAHEWTTALARWCEEQHELVAFTGTCLVHRAEILQLQGAWRDAIEEARRACDRFSRGIEQRPPAAAFYQQAEVHRLRGEFAAAEECYRNVSQWGGEPQPGLALLRLAQGRTDAAAAAMRRVMSATTDPLQRTKLLPAYIEIMLAVGETQEARDACRELDEAARSFGTDVLSAMAAQARGAVELAEGDAETALGSLRRASQAWQKIEAPYAAARVRVLVALGCRALGDEDGAALELAAARAIFDRLGAAPELTRIDSLTQREPSNAAHGLTARERQVLRLIAGGKTNRAIAAELSISEKTVARHVSNIFGKLGLSTRAAATAYAYQHSLA